MKLFGKNKRKLEEIYRLYESKMYYLAFSILCDEGQAEDAVHNSIIKVVEYLPKLKAVDSPECRALVMKITKSTAIDLYRATRKISGESDVELIEDSQNDIDIFLDEFAAKNIITQCLNTMPDSLKEIVKLKYFCQLSNGEVAEVLQVSVDVVRKRDERLKKFIKDKVGEQYEL